MTLPLPDIHSDEQAFDHGFARPVEEIARAAALWRETHALSPVSLDRRRSHLLVIDAQVDFSFPDGALFVAGRSGTGAMDANRNLANFIYRHLHRISQVSCTLDSHLPYQIFFPSFFLDHEGRPPQAGQPVLSGDLSSGRLRANPKVASQLGLSPDHLQKHCLHYCRQLEERGKPPLFLWPYHVLLGTPGHRLAGVIDQARLFHAFARMAANRPVLKGDNPLSERYSVFGEEVTEGFDSRPIPGAVAQDALLHTLLEADLILVAGLASSHCVRASLEDLFDAIEQRKPEMAQRVYLLEDCTAPVVIPDGTDFTEEAEAAMAALARRGLRRVRSQEPMQSWPGQSAKQEGSS